MTCYFVSYYYFFLPFITLFIDVQSIIDSMRAINKGLIIAVILKETNK